MKVYMHWDMEGVSGLFPRGQVWFWEEGGSPEVTEEGCRELASMHLSAQLAVLSACETGKGQHSGGEVLLGLTWAFRAAGCPGMVASLWRVEDESTANLMVAFYTGLRAGKRKDEARREAMLAVRSCSSGRGKKNLP